MAYKVENAIIMANTDNEGVKRLVRDIKKKNLNI